MGGTRETAETEAAVGRVRRVGAVTLAAETADARCPVCSWECVSSAGGGVLVDIGVPELDGRYCTRCWVATWAGHVPRLEAIPEARH